MPPYPYSPFEDITTEGNKMYEPPSKKHWLGTDNTGRDVLMMVKKHKKDLFSSPSSRVICVIILNPHENSKANAIYVINEKDLKFF